MERNLIVIKVEGISQNDALKGLGFEIKRGGWLYLNGKAVQNKGKKIRAKDVQAIVPDGLGGMKILSDPLDVVDYFNPINEGDEK